uniref:Ribose-phosphate pyrophosphokinase n=1 Tax=Candidatus Kentrum sp. LPFa TaxID=2126335 RepID=A0A450W1K4_9GAMM|nr:MAG: ribose-phosphate pyrophosphokinase [Candidatus Kentron sp. LPFa]VFK14932.1 MAG: ribose-phosphate pyrophosphokinase [Candidatus Kentron sp. LPFa]VFK28332.1 MAG: ribose-phosphate pyrophosphokinase [Candidatus Kentron sp. LPFa]
MTDQNPMMVFSGNSHPNLTETIVSHLHIPLGKAVIDRFSDGEVMVEIIDSVRGKDVFLVQPTSQPANENLMELLVLVDAVRRASAARVTAVIPYFGYARQDRRPRAARVAITAKLVANILVAAGVNRLVTMDLHSDQIQGFFNIPVDNVYASPILLGDIWRHKYENPMVVSPDVGGVVRARGIAKRLDEAQLAIIDKRRPQPNEAQVMNIIGDVSGRTCFIIDDMIDTAGTLCEAAHALKHAGARHVLAYCTHPILSGNAVENIEKSMLDEIVVTDTIPLSEQARKCKKIRQLSIAELLAESIRRINAEESMGPLIMD